MLYSNNYELLFVCETWLDNSYTNAMLDPQGLFYIHRKDRGSRGGGVCAFVSKSIKTCEVTIDHPESGSEITSFDTFCDKNIFRFFVIYRPPSAGSDQMKDLINCVKSNCLPNSTNLIIGDLNCPGIDWCNYCSHDGVETMFCDAVCKLGFSQAVNKATRKNSVLDIVLSNDPLVVSDLSVNSPFCKSDHNTLSFKLLLHQMITENSENLKPIYDWTNADFESLENYFLNFDWCKLLMYNFTADDLWVAFRDIWKLGIANFVPLKQPPTHAKRKCYASKLYPKEIKKLLSKKNILWAALNKNPNEHLKLAYNNVNNKCRGLIRKHALDTENKVVKADNLGAFYKHVNRKLSCKTGIGPIKRSDGSYSSTDVEKANIINNYFASVCTIDDTNLPPFQPKADINHSFEQITITAGKVKKVISKLKNNLSSGPDNLPPLFFKKLSKSLSEPLALLFNSLMSFGGVPTEWKSALVLPVFKKGVSSDVSNYRPISLTCVCSKLLECLIKDDMLVYLQKNNLISKCQHGFLSKHSTFSNLVESLNDWTISINRHNQTCIAFIDFAKAFDSVCHSKLIYKIEKYGISGNILTWITNFLSNRSQRSVVGNGLSDYVLLLSGVPQGSVLGPLLFLLFINDVMDNFSDGVITKLFADDVKMYVEITCPADYLKLQESLDYLYRWSIAWQLPISVQKCCTLSVGTTHHNNNNFYLNQMQLPIHHCVRDLGILTDNQLKFNDHICSIVSRAHARACLINRCFLSKNVNLLAKAFTVYVRPILEYCSSIWSPVYQHDIAKIESVQRRFTKRLPGLKAKSYTERLELLSLQTLERRRLQADLVMLFKIKNGLIDINFNDLFINQQNSGTRGHDFKIMQQYSRVNAHKHFFCNRIISCWNSLPLEAVHAISIIAFKKIVSVTNLDSHLHLHA